MLKMISTNSSKPVSWKIQYRFLFPFLSRFRYWYIKNADPSAIRRIKTAIKSTPFYTLYSTKRLRTSYADKIRVPYSKVKNFPVIPSSDIGQILENAELKNIGCGEFSYFLDSSILISKNKMVIDNMPVDYGYVLNNCHRNIPPELESYISRVHDAGIRLEPPRSLKDALQLILVWNSLLWQTGHTLVGLGRLDKVLAPYPLPENAETLIMDFLKTLHSGYDYKSAVLKGDTGQIIILGGLEENGSYYHNAYTYLFLNCLKKLHLPDPKILLRCSQNMPEDLLKLAVDCASTGIGSPLFSNDDVLIGKLMAFGYDETDAYNYGVSACWEPLSIGNSLEQNNLANIAYGKYLYDMICDRRFMECKTFEDVLSLYEEKLELSCEKIKQDLNDIEWAEDPLLTFLMGLEKDISTGSAKYNNYGILSVGMSSAVNSLLNIKRFVFEENKYSLFDIRSRINSDKVDEFKEITDGFGTDFRAPIELTNHLIKKTEEYLADYRNPYGGRVKFGLSSPSYVDVGRTTGATLDGRKAGKPFQTHISRDAGDPITEIINFSSHLEFSGVSSNANVIDIMVQSTLMRNHIDQFVHYIMGGIREGIFQLQMNVLSYGQLVDAKAHPEKYPGLIVRVWGFSAFFNDLPEEYKDNLIRRAKEMEHIA